MQAEGIAPPRSDYSHAVRVTCGSLLLISGQVPLDASGVLVGKHDFEAQTRQVFANLAAVLRAEGADFTNVVQFRTYLTHYAYVKKFARLRHELFQQYYPSGAYPPHTLLVVTSLAYPDYLIEVEAIAALDT